MQQFPADSPQNRGDVLLYDRFSSSILTFLYQQVSSQQDAEDLLLEVFIAALKNEAFSGLSTEQQLAWLRRVARNKVIDRYRHTAILTLLPLEEALETADGELTPEQSALQRENYQRLYQSIGQLAPLQQQLIWLRYANDLRLVEIASLLKKPEGTVRKMLARTLHQLRLFYDQTEREHIDETFR